MDGIALLAEARAAGLQMRVAGAHLIVRGPKRLAALAQHLLSHRGQVLTILEAFEERAAIAEYGGALSRTTAEGLAWQWVLGDRGDNQGREEAPPTWVTPATPQIPVREGIPAVSWRCPCCHGARRWRSIYGAVVCARCHPPADAAQVAAWEGAA